MKQITGRVCFAHSHSLAAHWFVRGFPALLTLLVPATHPPTLGIGVMVTVFARRALPDSVDKP